MDKKFNKEMDDFAQKTIKRDQYRKKLMELTDEQRKEMLEEVFGVTIEKMGVEKDDMIILRGEWSDEMIQGFVQACNSVGHSNRIMVLRDDQSLETMGIKQFYDLMKDLDNQIHGRVHNG